MELKRISRTHALLVGAVALGLIAAAVVLAFAGSAEQPGTAPEPLDAETSAVRSDDGSGAADTTIDPLAVVDSSASGTNGDNSGSSTDGPSGSETPETSPGADSPGTEGPGSATGTTTTLRILWWNDAVDKPLTDVLISVGGASWKPDPAIASATGALRNVPVGEPLVLLVRPDGADGASIEVDMLITESMSAAADRDAVTIAVSDTEVRVIGNPIDNIDTAFPRF